jgi:hypothetical protein
MFKESSSSSSSLISLTHLRSAVVIEIADDGLSARRLRHGGGCEQVARPCIQHRQSAFPHHLRRGEVNKWE